MLAGTREGVVGLALVDREIPFVFTYNCSTFSLAQGVLRKKVRLDFKLGL